MAQLGADTEQLHALALALRGAAGRLERSLATLEAARRATTWRGPDADRFAQDWTSQHGHDARQLCERWRLAADGLVRHGREQEQASAADATGLVQGGSDGRRGDGSRPAAPARGPRVEQQFLAGTAMTVAGATLALDHDVVVRRIDDRRSQIELSERRAVGASATAGAEVSVGADGHALLGASAAASASVGQLERRTYDVDTDQVWPMLARIEADAALGRAAEATRSLPAVGLAAAAVPAVVSIWDEVADLLPGPDRDVAAWARGLGVAPDPRRVETLSELTLQASLGASLAGSVGLSGNGELSGTLRHGTAEVDGRATTRVIEAEGRLATTLHSVWTDRLGLDEPAGARTTALRLELPLDGGPGQGSLATLTWTGSTEDSATRRSVAIDLSGAAEQVDETMRRSVARLTSAVATPTPSFDAVRSALDELAGLDLSGVTSPATTDQLELTRRTTGAAAHVGAGVSVGLSGDGGWTTATRVDR
jgi:hypothetical protein